MIQLRLYNLSKANLYRTSEKIFAGYTCNEQRKCLPQIGFYILDFIIDVYFGIVCIFISIHTDSVRVVFASSLY